MNGTLKISDAPEQPAQLADQTWAFNISVTTSATRLGALVSGGIPQVREHVFNIQYPAEGGSANAGEPRFRPPNNVCFQVSPAATGNVAMTYDNNTAPVATAGSEVGLQMLPGKVYQFPNVGTTLLRAGNNLLYPVDANTAFILIAGGATSVSVWFSD